jgi:hypothetical protein
MHAWWSRLLAVLLVLVVGNPLCCCADRPTPAAAQGPAEHACCAKVPDSQSDQHAPAKCDCCDNVTVIDDARRTLAPAVWLASPAVLPAISVALPPIEAAGVVSRAWAEPPPPPWLRRHLACHILRI